jgi:hypothetical protein
LRRITEIRAHAFLRRFGFGGNWDQSSIKDSPALNIDFNDECVSGPDTCAQPKLIMFGRLRLLSQDLFGHSDAVGLRCHLRRPLLVDSLLH